MIEAVEIPAPDGAVLRGEVRRAGPVWAVLVHDLGEDLDAWRPLRDALGRRGVSVLCFDLRGHGGSDGEATEGLAAGDLEAAVAFARAAGAERLVVSAAGESVGPALAAAAASGADGFFALAPRGVDFARSVLPKLSVCGSRDPHQEAAGSALEGSGGWSVVVRLPLGEPGLGMLQGPWRTNVEAYVLGFVRDVAGRAVAERA